PAHCTPPRRAPTPPPEAGPPPPHPNPPARRPPPPPPRAGGGTPARRARPAPRRPPLVRVHLHRHEPPFAPAGGRGGGGRIAVHTGSEPELRPARGVEPQRVAPLPPTFPQAERRVLRGSGTSPAPHQRQPVGHLVRHRNEPLPAPCSL